MPLDVNGIYSLPVPTFPLVSGTLARAADVNALHSDHANSFNIALVEQRDQQAEIVVLTDTKAPLASPVFTGTVGGITAAMVGAPAGSGTSTGTNTGDQTNITGNAATATNVAYSGLTGIVPTWNQNTTGSAGTATTATTATTANALNTANAYTVAGLTVGNGVSSSIIMVDTDNGNRIIHCNSNRIGFIKQDGAWGSYCDDFGNWTAEGTINSNAGTFSAGAPVLTVTSQSLGANGFRITSDGFIEQWGSLSVALDSAVTIAFPIAFPTAVFQTYATRHLFNPSASSSELVGTDSVTLSAMRVWNNGSASYISWFAIGQ